jgi:SlyX protein
MIEMSELEQRVGELEAHSAHQESVIQDLSDGIAKQWATIDRLVRTIEQFKNQILSLEEGVQTALPEKLPPHY